MANIERECLICRRIVKITDCAGSKCLYNYCRDCRPNSIRLKCPFCRKKYCVLCGVVNVTVRPSSCRICQVCNQINECQMCRNYFCQCPNDYKPIICNCRPNFDKYFECCNCLHPFFYGKYCHTCVAKQSNKLFECAFCFRLFCCQHHSIKNSDCCNECYRNFVGFHYIDSLVDSNIFETKLVFSIFDLVTKK